MDSHGFYSGIYTPLAPLTPSFCVLRQSTDSSGFECASIVLGVHGLPYPLPVLLSRAHHSSCYLNSVPQET